MLTSYQRSLLITIYDAYARLRVVPRDTWNDDQFYDVVNKTSSLFGHYVHSILPDMFPGSAHYRDYMLKAAPLSHAINIVLDLILDKHQSQWDAYSVSNGMHPAFPQAHPYDRAMAMFALIESKYPEATYGLQKVTTPVQHTSESH